MINIRLKSNIEKRRLSNLNKVEANRKKNQPSLSTTVKPLKSDDKRIAWFLNKERQSVPSSPTEIRIGKVLRSMGLKINREVCFIGIPSYTFDFYIPEHNIAIEYDGAHHEKKIQQIRDAVKTSFCKKFNITLLRFNKQHYAELEKKVYSAIRGLIK